MAKSMVATCVMALALLTVHAAHAQQKPPPVPSALCIQQAPPEAQRSNGDTDQLTDACLGPTRFRIPANYFDDQRGPDFQSNFVLVLEWPSLQPLPPGKVQNRDSETYAKQVSAYPHYVDRVPIETLLDRYSAPLPRDGFYRDDNPSDHLNMMDKQPQRFGLTPYYVNREKFNAFWGRRSRIDGHKSYAALDTQQDWYLGRDANGRLTTLIKCDSHLKPDGYIIQGDRLVDDGSHHAAQCNQKFIIEEDKIEVSIDYPHIFLKDWKRFEDRFRAILSQYRVR